jgi:hypothetical protein
MVTDAERIAVLELAVAELREHMARLTDPDRYLNSEVARAVSGRAFSARGLFQHAATAPELRAAFVAAGIRDARQLGKALQRLSGRQDLGLRPLRRDRDAVGAIWSMGW